MLSEMSGSEKDKYLMTSPYVGFRTQPMHKGRGDNPNERLQCRAPSGGFQKGAISRGARTICARVSLWGTLSRATTGL